MRNLSVILGLAAWTQAIRDSHDQFPLESLEEVGEFIGRELYGISYRGSWDALDDFARAHNLTNTTNMTHSSGGGDYKESGPAWIDNMQPFWDEWNAEDAWYKLFDADADGYVKYHEFNDALYPAWLTQSDEDCTWVLDEFTRTYGEG